MSTPDRAKRRPRRIAADEAHAWARNLRFYGNHQAKLLLATLTLYIDAEGCSFVSIPQLAEDTELSTQTIRRRLVWLESVGVIERIPLWIDEYGNRNSEARGKRTSDRIRLCLDRDADDIEEGIARLNSGTDDAAASDTGHHSAEFSPTSQIGLNSEAETVSPAPALRQPYHCGQGLISEPEPESFPLPPSRGRESASPSVENEPDDFGPAWTSWPGHEVMRRDLALSEFRQLSVAQQRHCRAAIPLFIVAQARLKRSTMPNFHLWVRTRGFEEFPNAKLQTDPAAQPDGNWIVEGSDEDRALRFLRHLARQPQPFVRQRGDGTRGYPHKGDLGADLLAMLPFADESPLRWSVLARGTPQCAAWQQRFVAWIGQGLPVAIGDAGIRVPCPWPPRKDGSFFEGDADEPQQGAAAQEGRDDSAA